MVRNPLANEDVGSIPKSGRYPGEGNGNEFHNNGNNTVLLPGKSQRQRSLAGYRPWGGKSVRHNLATKQNKLLKCNLYNVSKPDTSGNPFPNLTIKITFYKVSTQGRNFVIPCRFLKRIFLEYLAYIFCLQTTTIFFHKH